MTSRALILGPHGYMGSAFCNACFDRCLPYYPAAHARDNYFEKDGLRKLLKEQNPMLVINCAAYIPTPSVDACKDNVAETFLSNVQFPATLAAVCEDRGVPLIHLSTGCLYDEDKEYTEGDETLRKWDDYCGFYVGTKLLAEQTVSLTCERSYILRLRLPFDGLESPRNYLAKLMNHGRVWTHRNSISHRADFAKAALDLWEKDADYGVYHVTNPGFVDSREIIEMMFKRKLIMMMPEFVSGPVPGCTLSTKKLLATGVKIRSVQEALCDSLDNWAASR